MRKLSLAFVCLLLSPCVQATELRLAYPSAYGDDVFITSLLSSQVLRDAGLSVAAKKLDGEAEAMNAVKSGAADIGVFTLADEDLRKLQKAGDETSLLTRPFVFKSAAEVFLMQKSFLGDAAAADLARSGLFPLKIWNHAITYFLTREPIRSAEDFSRLTVAAENGAPDVKILSAVGARAVGAKPVMNDSKANESMSSGGANALETQLGATTQEFAAKYDGKLYLTTGWPESGLLAASPGFWTKLSEAEKNAIKTAAAEARQASDRELITREEKIRKIPNVEVNHLDHGAQMELAMNAGGGGMAAQKSEMGLWHKAEVEVHGQPSTPAPAPVAPKMASTSPVYFATDRDDEGTLDYTTRFGSRRLYPLETTCGFLGAPVRHSGEPKLPPAPKVLTKGVEECAKQIVARTRASGLKKILFVIHGFNTSFDKLARRALQVGSDLDYDGTIVGWSWPSEGSAFGYAYDEDSSAWSEPHLVEMVGEIAAQGPELQLDFVAHSMGNRILLQMLRELAQAHSTLRVGAAIFAAPDVAQDVFREQIRTVKKIGVLRTLYASQYDRAILISESYHGAPRAGSGGADILVVNGIESVDARLGGHSYVFDEPKAIRDFRAIVNRETKAAARGLEEREKSGAPYWVIEP